ncbi:MAG TPA: hypothetical protein VFM86_01175 [Pedococcus sp.]|nr:hypothetical protein [Pedococcus sp.]
MPSDVLKNALLTEVMRKSYTVDTEDSGDFGMPGGLDISYYGTWVSGDRACKPLFEPHPVDPSAFAFVGMHNTSVEFAEATESYATVADAKRVMAQNFAQAKGCHTFRMKDAAHGEVVRYTHSVTATRHGTIDLFLHHFNGSTAEWIYDFHMFEGRVDGEMVHIIWGSSGGKTDPSVPAFRQFQKVVGAYRAGHPRSTA